MLPEVTAWLAAAADVTAIVGTRIYRRGFAPQGTVESGNPYVTWFVVDAPPENTLSERPGIARATVQVDCWSKDDRESVRLAEAVRNALETHGHQTGQPVDGRDPETKKWRFALQFDFWVKR